MSRKLLALAVAASLAAPAVASAQQQVTINMPEIYGRLHLSLNHMDNGAESALNLSDNSSRIGFRGDMGLAPGLEAFYQIEAGYLADQGGGELASRNTFVGVRGAFGALQAGFFDTPIKNIGSKVDLFSDQVGDNGNIIRFGVGSVHFDQREDNMIQYTTPTFSGLQAVVAYSTNVDDGTAGGDEIGAGGTPTSASDDEQSYMAALAYTGVKGLWLGLGYQQYGEDVAGGGDEANIIRLGAAYTLGALKLTALAQQASDLNNGDDDIAAYGIGAAYALGKTVLKAQYYMLDHDAAERNTDMIAIGADYKVSKNFTTYVTAAFMNNDDNVVLVPYRDGINDPLLPGDSAGPTEGEDTFGVGIGAIYNF